VQFLNIIILFDPLVISENNLDISNSYHAEVSALNKLPFNSRKKKINIDLVVIRVSRANTKMSCSMPCIGCINYMLNVIPIRGYRIKKIFYSTDEGEMKETTLNELMNNKKHITKLMKRKLLHEI
tara:strand:+ start:1730 stop:2104 length:375 start_codon:yes stop_codon:yes gene_type:complete